MVLSVFVLVSTGFNQSQLVLIVFLLVLTGLPVGMKSAPGKGNVCWMETEIMEKPSLHSLLSKRWS